MDPALRRATGRGACLVLPLLCVVMALPVAVVDAADADWPLYGRDYANQRYSPLRQIHAGNVAEVQPVWRYSTGRRGSFQATPIVRDGVMFLTTPFNDLVALDAASGQVRWRYRHQLRGDDFCCGPANRGAAVADGKVYMATIDARLIALDAADGSLLWDVGIAERQAGEAETAGAVHGITELRGAQRTGYSGYSANMAPQVHDGKVLVGITGVGYGLHLEFDEAGENVLAVGGLAGGRHGRRGLLAAYDADTGAELWRWYTVPEKGWEGEWRETTHYGGPWHRDMAAEQRAQARHADSWRRGGGSVWTTPALDAERGLLFVGTGNPAPQMADATRPGDNLYTVSLVALELETGRLRWHYQQVPHDRWGYDVASPPVLLEVNLDGKPVAAVGQASKLGWFFLHERDSGRLLLRSRAFVPQENLFAPPTAQGVRIAPGTLGAVSWSPVAYHPGLGLAFIAGIHQPSLFYSRDLQPTPEQPWRSIAYFRPLPQERWGVVAAVDVDDGSIRWQQRMAQPMVGGMLATAGGLVFTGEGDGRFLALDATDGRVLWSHRAPFGVNAPAVSYAVEGRQYVAVAAGGNALFGYPVGDLVLAFALPPAAAAMHDAAVHE